MSGLRPSNKLWLKVEQWPDIRDEMLAVWKKHNDEIASPEDRDQLAPDWKRFDELHIAGAVHWVTIRHFGKIVGYVFVLVSSHLHRKDTLCGFYDLYWLDPDYRKGWTGVHLLKFCESTLRARGVRKAYIGTKVWKDIGPLLTRLGYTEIERLYSKAL